MDRKQFWSLIEQTKHKDTEEMFQNLTESLSKLPIEDVQLFRGYLSAYMAQANDCIWVDMVCKVINGGVSDDTGLCFVLWLIAQGERTFYAALKNPDALSELAYIPFGNAEFEMLMTIGMDQELDYSLMGAVLQKCSEEIQPTISYKNDSKYGKYESFEDGMEDISNVLPLLIQRARKEGFDWKDL